MANKNNDNAATEQAWPSFVDILSSTVLVLSFALLVLVIVLSVTRVTTSIRKEDHETSPTSIEIEATVLGDFKQEFQEMTIIANPSLREENQIKSDDPVLDEDSANIPVYVPNEAKNTLEKVERVKEVGKSTRQVLGDIPKAINAKSLEVLQELIIVQRDVIEQQRKVIEQQDADLEQTVREYQSLLSIVTKEKEVEDIRQKINPKDAKAQFLKTDDNDSRITGTEKAPDGAGSLFLNPPNNPVSKIIVEEDTENNETVFKFQDNAPFIYEDSVTEVNEMLSKHIASYKQKGVVLTSKISDYAVSSAESQRIAVERLLLFRSMLVEAGVPSELIKLKTIGKAESQNDDSDNSESDSVADKVVLNYGWVNVTNGE